jgi:hypothetical protein
MLSAPALEFTWWDESGTAKCPSSTVVTDPLVVLFVSALSSLLGGEWTTARWGNRLIATVHNLITFNNHLPEAKT